MYDKEIIKDPHEQTENSFPLIGSVTSNAIVCISMQSVFYVVIPFVNCIDRYESVLKPKMYPFPIS